MNESIESMLRHLPQEALHHLENELSLYSRGKPAGFSVNDECMDQTTWAWSLDILLLRWMQQSSISDDPRSVRSLKYLLVEYNRKNPDASLELDHLISNGWVRIVWDSYRLPHGFIFYKSKLEEKPEHVFEFMRQLSNEPYPDTCTIRLHDVLEILREHQASYTGTPQLEWFLDNGILSNEGKGYVLNSRSNYVAVNANFILARLWMEKKAGPSKAYDRLSWWIRYVSLNRVSNEVLRGISSASLGDLLDACLDRLLNEEDGIDWEAERRKMIGEVLAEQGSTQIEKQISWIPLPREDQDLEKLFWFDRPLEAAIVMHYPRGILGLLFNWIVRGEGSGTAWPDRPRLHKLLAERKDRPFIYHELKHADHTVIPTLLINPDLTVIGMALLAMWEPSYPGDFYSRETKEEAWKIEERIWIESLSYFSYAMNRILISNPMFAASRIEQCLTWFEELIRKKSFTSAGGPSSKLYRKREHMLAWLYSKFIKLDRASSETIIVSNWTSIILAILDTEDIPLEHPSFPQLLWLIQLHGNGGPVNRIDEIMECVIHAYHQTHRSCRDSWVWTQRIADVIQHPAWEVVLKWAMVRIDEPSGNDRLSTLLQPFQIEDLSKERPQEEKKQHSWIRLASQIIALHLQRLARWIADLQIQREDTGYRMLISVFSSLLEDSLKHYGNAVFLSFELMHGFSNDLKLVNMVAKAINFLPDRKREQLLRVMAQVDQDPGLWANIYNGLERETDRKIILTEYSLLKDEALTQNFGWNSDFRVRITELLNTNNIDLADLAQQYLDRFRAEASPRVLVEYEDWAFQEQLRIHLVKKEFRQIHSSVPQPISAHQANTLTYYCALAYLEMDPPDAHQSIALLEPLVRQDAGNVSYLVNLYGAYIEAAADAVNTASHISGKFIDKAEHLLNIIQALPEEQRKTVSGHIDTNRLYLESILKNSSIFWQIYGGLKYARQNSIPIGTYAVHMLLHEQKWEEAERKLEILHQRHGKFESYTELLQTVKERKQELTVIPPHHFLQELRQWTSINTALSYLNQLSSEEQVKALKGDEFFTVKDYILETFLDVCREVLKYSPSITPSETQQAEEDRYTDLLVLLLNQRLLPIGWSAVTQSRGGYTRKTMGPRGGIGERDIIIYNQRHTELAIGEALNLAGLRTDDIRVHTQKIFGYDTTRCNFYIVLTWGFAKNPDILWSQYKTLVASKTENPFPVIDYGETTKMFPTHNFQAVRSFYTMHETDMEGEKAVVVHLYVDVLSEKQKDIAEKARKNFKQ